MIQSQCLFICLKPFENKGFSGFSLIERELKKDGFLPIEGLQSVYLYTNAEAFMYIYTNKGGKRVFLHANQFKRVSLHDYC